MKRYCLTTFAVACTLAVTACASLAPSYERPAMPVPASWPQGVAYAAAKGASAASSAASAASGAVAPQDVSDIPWREFVLDERLRQVVQLALDNSRDLRKAAANVEAARATYRVQRASQVPTLDASVSASRSRSVASASGDNVSTVTSGGASLGLGVTSWEIDIFGRLRNLSDASLQTYLATEATQRATRVSLIGETATAWLTLASDRSKLTISRQTLESAQRSMQLNQRRLDIGVATRVDVRQAETVYQQARADVASLTTSIAQDRNALELLAGSSVPDSLLPDSLPDVLLGKNELLADVPAGVSSSVLLSRPDVLAAEHQLQAANADIGAARAALFPTLSLTASGGVASAALSTLLSGGAAVWSIAPSVVLPIFDGGKARANVDYARAEQLAYLASYELSVQTAFREVADALALRGTVGEQIDAQQALVDAAADSFRLAQARYERGADTFLNALDAQRTLYSAQTTLVSTRLSAIANRVTLYKTLGGGAQ